VKISIIRLGASARVKKMAPSPPNNVARSGGRKGREGGVKEKRNKR